MELVEKLCQLGNIALEVNELGYGLVFEPYEETSLPEHMRSSVFIARKSLSEAVSVLDQYIKNNKHCSEYEENFFTGQA